MKEDLHIDSLEVVDIAVFVENVFGYKIKPEEFKGLETFEQFCQFIGNKIG